MHSKLSTLTFLMLGIEIILLFTNLYWFIWLVLPTAGLGLATLIKGEF